MFAVIAALLAGTAPSVLGYEGLIVTSGSMAPAILVGDMAVVAPIKPAQMSVGDIITYRSKERPDIIITHRIVEISHDDLGQIIFHTKGDANETVDQVQVNPTAVVGRVAYIVPKIGYVVDFARSAEGKMLLFGLPAALLLADWLISARRQQPAARPAPHPPSPHKDVGLLLARGRKALWRGDFVSASRAADRALALLPQSDDAWLLKSRCLPPGPESVMCLRTGLTINPNSARLREALARAEGRFNAAVR